MERGAMANHQSQFNIRVCLLFCTVCVCVCMGKAFMCYIGFSCPVLERGPQRLDFDGLIKKKMTRRVQ